MTGTSIGTPVSPVVAPRKPSGWIEHEFLGILAVGLASFGGGVLTAYAQGSLPDKLGSLANSSGSWTLTAFFASLAAARWTTAAFVGATSLGLLLLGYVVGVEIRGSAWGWSMVAFWGLAAVTVGPVIGVAAHAVKLRHRAGASLGIGLVAGVLVGEGVYGVAFISDTTYGPFWVGEIIVGLGSLAAVAILRLDGAAAALKAVTVMAVVSVAFVVVYSQGLMAAF